MKGVAGSLFALLFILYGCGPQENREKQAVTEEVELKFRPAPAEAKTILYRFIVDSPQDETVIEFNIDIDAKITARESGKSTLQMAYNKVCLDGVSKGEKLHGCAGMKDTLPEEIKRLSTPVFTFLNATFELILDERMRNTGEKLITADTTRTEQLQSQESRVQFFSFLPGQKVKPGDTWEEDIEIKSGLNKKIKSTFKLESIESGLAHISFSGDIDTDGQRFGHEFNMKGTLKGRIVFDVKSGWPVKSEMNQNFILSMNGNETPINYRILLETK